MKKFVNQKFLNSLFNTYCRNVDILTAENFLQSETLSQKDYENCKLQSMMKAQELENNILIRRNKNSKNEISKLYYF